MSKKDGYTKEQLMVSGFAKALAHPARLVILKILFERTNCTVNEIVHELPLAQSTVSRHLKELKEAGLLKYKIEAPKIFYTINHQEFALSKQLLNSFFEMEKVELGVD